MRSLIAASFLVALGAQAQPAPSIQVNEITEATHPFQTLQCARTPVQYRMLGNSLELVLGGQSRLLIPAISGSGARYQAPGDPDTVFWGKGPRATVTWSGHELPQCAPAGVLITPFRASGNEPFWAVNYDGWSLTLAQPGQAPVMVEAQVAETTENGQTIEGGEGEHAMRLVTQAGLCTDDMSGMPHPQSASLHYQGQTMSGCGGDPQRLLQGTDWKVVSINQQPIHQDAATWMAFLPEGKLVGNAGCNRFFGSYVLSGEGIQFSQLGATRMACEPHRMQSENQFMKHLISVNRFSFDTEGRLVLHADEDELTAVTSAAP